MKNSSIHSQIFLDELNSSLNIREMGSSARSGRGMQESPLAVQDSCKCKIWLTLRPQLAVGWRQAGALVC